MELMRRVILKKKKEKLESKKTKEVGNAANVDRTHDLQIFSLTLSQLSYTRHIFREGGAYL